MEKRQRAGPAIQSGTLFSTYYAGTKNRMFLPAACSCVNTVPGLSPNSIGLPDYLSLVLTQVFGSHQIKPNQTSAPSRRNDVEVQKLHDSAHVPQV